MFGVQSAAAEARLREVFATPIAEGTPVVVCNLPTAELVKGGANAFLATKISFINALAEMADATGADVTQLAEALGYDKRIGRGMLNAGPGYGGGCLPKDLRAFMHRAGELGVEEVITLLREVDDINQHRRARIVDLTHEMLGGRVDRQERHRARRRVQGRYGRRPRLARARRGRPDPAARRERHRVRPGGDGERPPGAPDPALRPDRRSRRARGARRTAPDRVARVPRTRPGRAPRDVVDTPVIIDARLNLDADAVARRGLDLPGAGQACKAHVSADGGVAGHRAGQCDAVR